MILFLNLLSDEEYATISFVASILPAVADAAIPTPNELNLTSDDVATACPIEIVTAPVAPLTVTPVPATFEVTPVFVMVTAPVAPLTEIPVPATFEVTPALVRVIEPPNDTAPPPLIPVPAVTVTEEFVSFAFEIEPANIASVTPRFAIDIVLVVEISPPPVNPLPAVIDTAV